MTKEEFISFLQNPDYTRFQEIALALFNHFLITKQEIQYGSTDTVPVTYSLEEIEFYYYGEGHRDRKTYIRMTNAGQLFFHGSGIDIAFETKASDDKQELLSFGGILIRSMVKHSKNGDSLICGPLRCCDEIQNNNADVLDWNMDYHPAQPITGADIDTAPRTGLGDLKTVMESEDSDIELHDYKDAPYKFYIKRDSWNYDTNGYTYLIRQKNNRRYLKGVLPEKKQIEYSQTEHSK